MWFSVKYATGLLVLTATLGLPLLVAGSHFFGSVEHLRDRKELLVGMLLFSWLVIEAYSLAMLAQCLVRQPLYAAVVTLGGILFSFLFASKILDVEFSSVLQAVPLMILILVGTVYLAWKTVKHDWGGKH